MKHWVFDLDGTLIDSSYYFEKSIFTILTEFGYAPEQKDLDLAYQFFDPSEYFRQYFASDEVKIQKGLSRLLELSKSHIKLIQAFEGIEEVLIHLRSKNVKVSVWTGREIETTRGLLNSTGLAKYVDLCVTRSCVAKTKPNPDGLLKILMDSKDHGDDVVMVGDHQYDIQGARSAKVKAISVAWNGNNVHPVLGLADHHFTEVALLKSFVTNYYDKN